MEVTNPPIRRRPRRLITPPVTTALDPIAPTDRRQAIHRRQRGQRLR